MRQPFDTPWIPSSWTARDSHLRVSSAERNEVTEALSKHYADGRLDDAELKERLDRSFRAKTRADLADLMDDLPPLSASGPRTIPPRRRHPLVALVLMAWASLLLMGAVTATVHLFWLPALFLGLFLSRRYYRCGHHHRHGW